VGESFGTGRTNQGLLLAAPISGLW
jgi:hypothetical protein